MLSFVSFPSNSHPFVLKLLPDNLCIKKEKERKIMVSMIPTLVLGMEQGKKESQQWKDDIGCYLGIIAKKSAMPGVLMSV